MSDPTEGTEPGTDSPDPTLVKKRKEKRREDRVRTSTRISESVRYVSFGMVAVTFSLLLSDSSFAKEIVTNHKSLLVISAFWGCSAILLDYLQYSAGYLAAYRAGLSDEGNYSKDPIAKILKGARTCMFYFKQIFVIIGTLFLLSALLQSI